MKRWSVPPEICFQYYGVYRMEFETSAGVGGGGGGPEGRGSWDQGSDEGQGVMGVRGWWGSGVVGVRR